MTKANMIEKIRKYERKLWKDVEFHHEFFGRDDNPMTARAEDKWVSVTNLLDELKIEPILAD